jgi:hypothetical protein
MPDATEIIRHSVAKLERAESPDTLRPRIAGEIDMAYKLDLITYQEREHLMGNMVAACGRRRNELHRAKLARLGIKQ